MGEIILYMIVIPALEQALANTVEYILKKVVDETGRCITQIIYQFDSDGDGVNDAEEVLCTVDTIIPDMESGFTLCNDGDTVGVGFPMFDIIDGYDIGNYIDITDIVTGTDGGVIVDYDYDGHYDDVFVPLPYDMTGDGVPDWGQVIDDDDNNLPDASPEAPFFPIGTPEFTKVVESKQQGLSGGIIIMGVDGTMTVYDPNGKLVREDYNKAYDLWLQDNAALDKYFSKYSVTEALLLLIFFGVSAILISKLFRRRKL